METRIAPEARKNALRGGVAHVQVPRQPRPPTLRGVPLGSASGTRIDEEMLGR